VLKMTFGLLKTGLAPLKTTFPALKATLVLLKSTVRAVKPSLNRKIRHGQPVKWISTTNNSACVGIK
jgi:hypothetical protein